MTSNGTRTINGISCNVYTYTVESSESFDKVIFALSDKSKQTGNLDYSYDMESTLYADRDVYLVNNISGWNDKTPTSHNSKGVWDGTQDVYQFTISAATLTTNQFQFRPKASDSSDEMSPSGSSYLFDFSSNGQWNSYDSYSDNNDFKNTGISFIIDHPNINAAEYKITVYIKYESWGRKYTTKAEIVDMPLTISDASGYATFSCDRALDFSSVSGITAYTASAPANGSVTMTEVSGAVPANTGLFIKGTASETPYSIPVVTTSSASAISGNYLHATDGNSVAAGNYVFAKQDDEVGFYRLGGATVVPKGKAYLSSTVASGARLSINFDEATAISSVKSAADENSCFDLQGRRVAQPSKGLYIINGKKVIK